MKRRAAAMRQPVQRREELRRQGDVDADLEQRNKHVQHVLVDAARLAFAQQ
ncbi:MAG: hypothetical protein WB524_02115 [Acidobacteriaceae bacterium]